MRRRRDAPSAYRRLPFCGIDGFFGFFGVLAALGMTLLGSGCAASSDSGVDASSPSSFSRAWAQGNARPLSVPNLENRTSPDAKATDPLTAGRESMADGDPSGAAVQFQRILQVDPNDPVALNNLAVALANSGDYHGALELLRHAAAVAPGRADIIANLSSYQRWLDQRSNVQLDSPAEDNAPADEDAAKAAIPPLWSSGGGMPQAGPNGPSNSAPNPVPAAVSPTLDVVK